MSDKLNWYVVKAINEKKVKQYLDADITRLGLLDRILQVIIPMEKYWQERKNGTRVVKERPFLPGYVLVEAKQIDGRLDPELEHIIKNVNGVIGFLTEKDGVPTPMRQSEVTRFLGIADEIAEREAVLELSFAIGDMVRVTDGPFAGFDGEIEEINTERRKLIVKVKVFGRFTPLELSYTQVEKE